MASDLVSPNATVKETATQLALHHGFLVYPLTTLKAQISDTQEVNVDPRRINPNEGTDCPTGGVLGNMEDLLWFNKGKPTIDVTWEGVTATFKIALNTLESSNPEFVTGNKCVVAAEGTYGKGKCEHLRECAQLDFKDDVETFKSLFFCPIYSISGAGSGYAGSCCMVETV